ncbi:hypothetical protein [Paraburkholderia sp. 32]|uniref:hypothetical protein n=1 Tax=Paraburkholderia sp. 32 TaxID=2991057 RepID=UPI003D1D3C3C
MDVLIVVLDFLSRVITVLISLGALLGFGFRRWIGAWIDARFKRQVDSELKTLDHNLALALEDKKIALAKDMAVEIERLKSQYAFELDQKRRQLDNDFRKIARLSDAQSSLNETFTVGYTNIFSDLYALDGEYINILNKIQPDFGKTMRDSYRAKAHRSLVELQRKLNEYASYTESELNLQIAEIFRDLSEFMAEGAEDRSRLDELSTKQSMIRIQMRDELLRTST